MTHLVLLASLLLSGSPIATAIEAPRPAMGVAWSPAPATDAEAPPATTAPAPRPATALPSAVQSPEALIAQAEQQLLAYQYEAALALAEQAVALDPLHLEANRVLRTAHAALRSSASLQGRYQQLLQQYPESAAVYYLMSTAARGSDLRKSYLLEALRRDPNFGPAVQAMASLTYRDRNSDEGLEWARRAVGLMPGDYAAASTYYLALTCCNRDAEALAFLQQMVAQYPGETRFLTRLWSERLRAMGRNRDISALLPEIEANRYRFMGSMQDMEALAGLLSSGGAAGRAMAADVWLAIAERYPEHPRAEVSLLRAADFADTERKIEILGRLLEIYPESPLRYAVYERMINALIADELFEDAIELAKEVIAMPDPGFEEVGVGRDRIARTRSSGQTLVCLGHSGWFTAGLGPRNERRQREMALQMAQVREQEMILQLAEARAAGGGNTVVFVSPNRPDVSRIVVDGNTRLVAVPAPVIAPEAATAARSLRDSACAETEVLRRIGQTLVRSASERTLGIELVEKALVISERSSGRTAAGNAIAAELTRLRLMLADLYLEEGRVEEAVVLVDSMVAAAGTRGLTGTANRTAGKVYEAAGRLHEAKHYYLRALSRGRGGEEISAALARIYRALASNELQFFDAATAPALPIGSLRLLFPERSLQVKLERFLTADLTLVVAWAPDLATSGDQLPALTAFGATYGEAGLGTLSIALASSISNANRSLRRTPDHGPLAIGTFTALAGLGLDELPVTMLVDATGRVWARQMSFGVHPDEWARRWGQIIEAALAAQKER
jgi:tetratricopeptide (TPR) repeat protein